MRKIFGLTYGGLQKKMVNLVMGILLITVGVFAVLAFFQSRMLTDVVEGTRVEQEQAISKTSEDTMLQVMEGSLSSLTSLQASTADNDFAEVVHNVSMLQSMAAGLWAMRDSVEPVSVSLPDPANDGTVSAMALSEEGVDPSKSEYIGILGHLSIPMTSMVSNSDKISACYIGFEDGTHLAIDLTSSNKLDANGKPIPFPVRERPWYTGAVEEGGISFTGIIPDAFSGDLCITCSAPVIVDGELIGVAGADIILESMVDVINNSSNEIGFAFIVNDDGQVVLAPENNYLFSAETADKAQDLRQSSNKEVAQFVTDALNSVTDLKIITIGDKDYYLAGAPMPTVKWALISIVDKEATQVPEKLLLEEYGKINEEASGRFRAGTGRTLRTVILVILLIALIGFFAALHVSRRIVRPIEEMTKDINISSQTSIGIATATVNQSSKPLHILSRSQVVNTVGLCNIVSIESTTSSAEAISKLMLVAGSALGIRIGLFRTSLRISSTVKFTVGINHATLLCTRHRVSIGSNNLIPDNICALIAIQHISQLTGSKVFSSESSSLMTFNLEHVLALYLAFTPESLAINISSSTVAIADSRVITTHPCTDTCILTITSDRTCVVAVRDVNNLAL